MDGNVRGIGMGVMGCVDLSVYGGGGPYAHSRGWGAGGVGTPAPDDRTPPCAFKPSLTSPSRARALHCSHPQALVAPLSAPC